MNIEFGPLLWITVGAIALSLISITIAILALVKAKKSSAILHKLLSGKKAKDLESVILSMSDDLQMIDKDVQELFEISNKIHSLAFRGLHKIGIIRFNPFKDIGGNQSFVVALLDGKNNGLVISSLHTREGTRVYAKPVAAGKADQYPFTEEEIRAIESAKSQKSFKL